MFCQVTGSPELIMPRPLAREEPVRQVVPTCHEATPQVRAHGFVRRANSVVRTGTGAVTVPFPCSQGLASV